MKILSGEQSNAARTHSIQQLFLCAVTAALALAWSTTYADSTSAIQERTKELKDFRALLNSDDKYERLAAFEAGMASEDTVVQRMTQDIAFNSDDKTIQTMALKSWFTQRTNMVAELKLPDKPTDEQAKTYKQYAPSVVLTIKVKENNELDGRLANSQISGSLTPGGLIARSNYCELKLSLVQPTLLAGAFSCGAGSSLPATVQVQ